MTGVTVKDVNSHEFVRKYADFLKKSGKVHVPVWADLVKTGAFKELAPNDPDWFFVRCAAVARRVYLRSGIESNQGLGIGALRKIYGGCRRNGTRPNHHAIGSGSVARHVLKALESLNIVAKAENGGRIITPEGQRTLDRIAGSIKSQADE
eukprot:Colp12_sorted_trinity150504_noHs@481